MDTGTYRSFFSLNIPITSLKLALEREGFMELHQGSSLLRWYGGFKSQSFTRTGQSPIGRALQSLCQEFLHKISQRQILLKTRLQTGFPSPFQKGRKSQIWKMMSNLQVPFPYLLYPVRPQVFCFNVWWIPYVRLCGVNPIPHLILSN